MEATQPPNNKRKASSRIPDSRNEQRVLRSSARKDDLVDSGQQPSKEVIHELDGNGNGEKKGGRKITQKLNIYSRQPKPKIKIPFNELGQPFGADATEFANFIGTLVRKHISLAKLDWRDVELEAQKSLVWDHLQAFYELDSTALSYVYNTSHTKWKEWKADLKKTKFDPELTDAQLMRRCDERISKRDWATLIEYWRSPEFDARSARAKENLAKSTVSHTTGSKSHAHVTHEMADELGYAPRRDEVFIKTRTRKNGDHLSQAAPIIKQLVEAAENHPEWKEKSIQEGYLYARVCGMKEPRGRVRVLGMGPTPTDVGTPGTQVRMTTRVLVEIEARRQAEQRMDSMQEQMQRMQQQLNQLISQGGHIVATPSSQHGSNSRLNSREPEERNDDDEDTYMHRRVIRVPQSSFPNHQDESLIGMDVLLLAWNGPETPVAKATIISIAEDTIFGGEPLGPENYEVIVNVAIRRESTLPFQYDGLRYISDAVKMSIAWPSSKMKPYKTAAALSSTCH
ncbi:uncharacterized protein LOC100825363 [Brachypodium distachyon]|uniref:uncharacterized protein LOC100825363 n=1 Tax=Brachypodium distachyon TaxID=15368 RepID=UPI00052FDE3B|nr:uncharacterized protein LOC100825363 [Brachypodium distachyon]|eukprot:XP_014753358.1 uncharacterized protein LOC100825363 [Brachypodium distachyon]